VGLAADQTDYRVAQNINTPILTSDGQSAIGGFSFDLAGVMRGALGVGYSQRRYREAPQDDLGVVSVQARADFFPFQMTTVSFIGQRLAQDSGLGGTSYIDTRLRAEIDQSLRENLVFIFSASVANQKYLVISQKNNIRLFQGNFRYQANRWLSFNSELSYKFSQSNGINSELTYKGLLFSFGITVRR
jgi:hypothetical protein